MRRAGGPFAAVLAIGLALAPAASARPHDKLVGGLGELAQGKHPWAKPTGPTVQPLPGIVRDGEVLVDVYVKGAVSAGATALRAQGMRVQAVSRRAPERVVEGWLPIVALDDVARLDAAKAVVPGSDGVLNTGSVTSEGDAAHRGPQARALGPSGAGIPVGVISDSINKVSPFVAGSQSSGDLPADVQILNDTAAAGTDEGRAMAEIVYDTAPGIPKILFSRGTGGAATRVASIDALVAAGAKIITDDVGGPTQPFFQDGIVPQAVDRAKANGTAYFVAAGNYGRHSWEGIFRPVGSLNDFDPGPGADTRQTITTVPANRSLSLYFQWDDRFGGATNDFALDFYDANTNAFLGTVDEDNIASGLPMENAVLTSGSTPVTFAMEIRRFSGAGTSRLKWLALGAFSGALPMEFPGTSGAIDPDGSSARGALTVAAIDHLDSGLNDAETFSSRGPTVTRYFDKNGNRLATPDVRPKPDIAGADGVATSLADFNPFFGTSAAAPSAAGVAALAWSAKPSMSVDLLYALMRDPGSNIDCNATGQPDSDCGWGFLQADGKLNMALDSSRPTVAAALSPGAPDGSNGWFHSNVRLTWNVTDPDAPVVKTNCDPRTIATDGVVAFTCTAESPGGTTNHPVTIRRDTAPPSAPTITGMNPGAAFTISGRLPPQSKVGCAATDATAGVASCVVTGYSKNPGRHTLTATATDQSGLTSTSTLTYRVKPFAAKKLTIPTQSLRSVLTTGLACRVTVVAKQTTLKAILKVGHSVVGRVTAKKKKPGKATLRIKLSKGGEALVRRSSRAKFSLAITATSKAASTAKLKAKRALTR